jgi:hypothetical protein
VFGALNGGVAAWSAGTRGEKPGEKPAITYRIVAIEFGLGILLALNFNGDKFSWVHNVTRTSPRWSHRCYGLPQVAIHPQLSCHVTLGFSRHVVTVSVITFPYDIETGRSWMRWKEDDDAVILDLVPAPEDPWIILFDDGNVLRHLFGPTWSCIVSGRKPKLWASNPWPSPTLGRVLDYKHRRRRY